MALKSSFLLLIYLLLGIPSGTSGKESACLPMQETQEMKVRSLGWEDPLEEGTAIHSSILAWRIMDRGAWWAMVHGVAKGHD